MRKFLTALAGSSIMAIAVATPAMAQNAPAPAGSQSVADDEDEAEAIVITGTQIRGIAPVGSNSIGVSADQIKTTGVVDANQLLGQLPQSSFFLALPEPGGGAIGAGTVRVPISRPNLRNLPVGGSGSGALTLVLMDGHRVVPSGIEQSAVDAGIVPTSLLERFEAILDGASAVYGSDAVGGVINYITRKRYDGAEVSARYGFADDYWQTQISGTVGKTWDTGGISLSYEFSKNTRLLNGDRDYTSPINWINPLSPVTGVAVNGGPPAIDDLNCDTPNIQNAGAAGTSSATNTFHVTGAYTGPGTGAAQNPLFCAANQYTTLTPSQRKHSGFAVFSQDIGDFIKFDVTALYSDRVQKQNTGPFTASLIIRPTNPYYRCYAVLTSCANPQRVNFSYGPEFGYESANSDTTTRIWQVTPSLTFDLGEWQIRGSLAYGQSKTFVNQTLVDTTDQTSAINGITLATALNPYDISSTSQSVLDGLLFHNYVEGLHKMLDTRVIADGPLFKLPGGDVRVAVGVEYNRTTLRKISTDQTGAGTHDLLPSVTAGVTAKSVFGELVVPVFGADNGMPGMENLTLSASARYDTYGGGVHTFNPKFAFTYEPVDWITFRGNWGTSFRAPNPADRVGASNLLVRCIGAQTGCVSTVMQVPVLGSDGLLIDTDEDLPGIQTAPCYSTTAATCSPTGRQTNALASQAVYINLGGTDPNLKPETSTSWSIGTDLRPPFVPGLTLSATYWNITFKNIISLPQPAISLSSLFEFLPQNYTICRQSTDTGPAYAYAANRCHGGVGSPLNNEATNPYYKALLDFARQANGGASVVANAIANGLDIVYFADTRTTNLGAAKVSGIDAAVNYRTAVGFGSIDMGVSGAWLLKSTLQFAPGAVFVDQLTDGNARFRMTARLGATVGNFRTQATFRHSDEFIPAPATTRDPSQRHIPGQNVVDLSFQYNIEGSSVLTKDIQLSLIINNALDAKPVASKTAAGGSTGLSTIGRLIEFGISKKF